MMGPTSYRRPVDRFLFEGLAPPNVSSILHLTRSNQTDSSPSDRPFAEVGGKSITPRGCSRAGGHLIDRGELRVTTRGSWSHDQSGLTHPTRFLIDGGG
jgi:hypothetical protein